METNGIGLWLNIIWATLLKKQFLVCGFKKKIHAQGV